MEGVEVFVRIEAITGKKVLEGFLQCGEADLRGK